MTIKLETIGKHRREPPRIARSMLALIRLLLCRVRPLNMSCSGDEGKLPKGCALAVRHISE